MEYELTPEAIELGLSGALPAILEVGAQIGEFGRGERDSPFIVPARDDTPWRRYLKWCDAATPPAAILPELRRLDLRLVEARNRLLAHRLRDHSLQVVMWRRTRRVQIALVPSLVPSPAVASMRRLASRLGVRSTGPLVEVVDRVLEAAGSLDPGSRPHAVDLLREVGYYSGDPSLVVRDLIAITRTIA